MNLLVFNVKACFACISVTWGCANAHICCSQKAGEIPLLELFSLHNCCNWGQRLQGTGILQYDTTRLDEQLHG